MRGFVLPRMSRPSRLALTVIGAGMMALALIKTQMVNNLLAPKEGVAEDKSPSPDPGQLGPQMTVPTGSVRHGGAEGGGQENSMLTAALRALLGDGKSEGRQPPGADSAINPGSVQTSSSVPGLVQSGPQPQTTTIEASTNGENAAPGPGNPPAEPPSTPVDPTQVIQPNRPGEPSRPGESGQTKSEPSESGQNGPGESGQTKSKPSENGPGENGQIKSESSENGQSENGQIKSEPSENGQSENGLNGPGESVPNSWSSLGSAIHGL